MDVFASADTKNPQKLVDGGFATGPVTNFAGNRLTVIVPTANPAGIAGPGGPGQAGVKVVAAGDDVPITKYADLLIDNLAKQPGFPADYPRRSPRTSCPRRTTWRRSCRRVELGEGDAAIVYVTDARNSSKVTPVAVPDAANVPATYGVVTIKASKDPAAAAARSRPGWPDPTGQAILAQYGFLPPS